MSEYSKEYVEYLKTKIDELTALLEQKRKWALAWKESAILGSAIAEASDSYIGALLERERRVDEKLKDIEALINTYASVNENGLLHLTHTDYAFLIHEIRNM